MVSKPRVLILGVTGAIGRGLPALLVREGMEVTGVSRGGVNAGVAGVSRWQTPETLDPAGHEAVINLAGESVAQRWTEKKKQQFHDSRVGLTRRLVKAIGELPASQRPAVLINGSAVGIYGDRGDELLTETSSLGDGYLAGLCKQWEAAALEAASFGVRVVTLRTGVVLGRGADAFEKLAGVLRTGLGGKLGSGRQWMPWIHIEDLRRAIVHALNDGAVRGAVNGCAPLPERNADLTRKMAQAIGRPAILPVPGFALKLTVGGFASALLSSQRVSPAALEAEGFRFQYPALEDALEELLD